MTAAKHIQSFKNRFTAMFLGSSDIHINRKQLFGYVVVKIIVLELCSEVLIVEGLQGWLCEKLPEASAVSDRANANQLQDRDSTGLGLSTTSSGIMHLRRKKHPA